MSESKHTPGPWIPGCIVSDDCACNCTAILAPVYMGSVANVSVDNGKSISEGGNDSPPLEEAKANARLISAAPDLLEALKDLRSVVIRENPIAWFGSACMRRVEEAIAKAEAR